MQSYDIDDVKVDLGACWIHSYRKANPMHKHVIKHGVKPGVLEERTIGRVYFDGEEMNKFSE